jgi:hypothetical protein
MRPGLSRAWLGCALLASGCAGPSIQVRGIPLGSTPPPRPEAEKIEVYGDAPADGHYEVVARLDIHVEKAFADPDLESALPELGRQARLAGAQAVVVVEERRWRIGEVRVLHLTAAGIRFSAASVASRTEASAAPSAAVPAEPAGQRPQNGFGPRFPSGPAPAWQEPRPRLLWLARLGFDFGFTPLAWARTASGRTDTVHVNEGLRLDVGAIIPNTADGVLETQVTLGGKGWGISASNGSATSYSFPVEVLECLNLGRFRAGAGVAAYLWPTLQGSGIASSLTTHFDTALGPVAEVAFQTRLAPFWREGVEPRAGFALRYVWTRLDAPGGSASGSGLGVSFWSAF